MMLNRILLLILVFSSCFNGSAQTKYTVHRKNRMYLGISGGMNFSAAHVVKEYSLLVPTPQSEGYSDSEKEKDYQGLFKNKGSQFGLYFSYSFKKNLSIVFQPAYQTSTFNYLTAYSWSDTVNASNFSMEMMHRQKLS